MPPALETMMPPRVFLHRLFLVTGLLGCSLVVEAILVVVVGCFYCCCHRCRCCCGCCSCPYKSFRRVAHMSPDIATHVGPMCCISCACGAHMLHVLIPNWCLTSVTHCTNCSVHQKNGGKKQQRKQPTSTNKKINIKTNNNENNQHQPTKK